MIDSLRGYMTSFEAVPRAQWTIFFQIRQNLVLEFGGSIVFSGLTLHSDYPSICSLVEFLNLYTQTVDGISSIPDLVKTVTAYRRQQFFGKLAFSSFEQSRSFVEQFSYISGMDPNSSFLLHPSSFCTPLGAQVPTIWWYHRHSSFDLGSITMTDAVSIMRHIRQYNNPAGAYPLGFPVDHGKCFEMI